MEMKYAVMENIYGYNTVDEWRMRKAEKFAGTLRYEMKRLGRWIKRKVIFLSLLAWFLFSMWLCWIGAGMMIAAHPFELQGYHPVYERR